MEFSNSTGPTGLDATCTLTRLRYLSPRVLLTDLRALRTEPATAEHRGQRAGSSAYAATDRRAWSALWWQAREEPPFGAGAGLMAIRAWLMHIRVFGAPALTVPKAVGGYYAQLHEL